MDIDVELHCDRCGSANLTLPEAGDDGAQALCNDCSAEQGTLAELREELIACAMGKSAQALRSDLDKIP
jgi:hypothetical protein